MNIRGWFIFASITAGISVIAVLAILVPADLWTSDGYTATACLFSLIVFPSILPTLRPQNSPSDASQIGLIGPISKLILFLIGIELFALRMSLTGMHSISWAITLVTIAGGLIGYSILNLAAHKIDSAARQSVRAVEDARTQWTIKLNVFASQSDQDEIRRAIADLIEKIRFAANDRGNTAAAENLEITGLINDLEKQIGNQQDAQKIITKINTLLVQREQSVRATRSFA